MNDPAASRRVSKIRTALSVSDLPSVYLSNIIIMLQNLPCDKPQGILKLKTPLRF